MTAPPPKARGLLRPPLPVAGVALAKLGLLLACASAYGYDQRELYTIACSHHLAWGFLDRPPLTVAVLAAAVRIYGENLLTVRLVSALLGAAGVILAARLAQRLGATVRGQTVAALSVVAAPALLTAGHAYGAHTLDPLLVTVLALAFVRAVEAPREDATLAWCSLGVAAGLCVLASSTCLLVLLGLAVGVVASRLRSRLSSREPWLAVVVAVAVALPYLAWEHAAGWPGARALAASVSLGYPASALLALPVALCSQLLPVSLVLAVAGVVALVRGASATPARALGVAAIATLVALGSTGAEGSRGLVALYPLLLAAGAAAFDARVGARPWAHTALLVTLLATAVAATPFALPVLPVARYLAVARRLHLAAPPSANDDAPALPPRFASMFGWPELVRTTGVVVDSLAPADREEAVVLASGSARASALEVLGPVLALPPVISGSGAFYAWGAGGASGKVVVAVGGDEDLLRRHFRTVDVVTVFGHSLAAAAERRVRIYVCRDATAPLELGWGDFRTYD